VTRTRILFCCFAIAAVLACSGLLFIGSILVSAKPSVVGEPPKDLTSEAVKIPKGGDQFTHAWFLQGQLNKAGILLLHGVKSDRMLGRAKFLFAAGFSVLLIDMQAHGETIGDYITFGFLESIDVHHSLTYLRKRVNNNKVAIIGSSMGGAAALLGDQPVEADAVILEGVYATLEQAIENRIAIRLGDTAKLLSPLLTMQFEPRLGVPLESVRPVAAISNLRSPVLIMSGAEDRHALPSEAQALYDAANHPKSILFVEGAAHQDLHRYDTEAYEKAVLDFLSKYLY